MLDIIKTRMAQGYRTAKYPKTAPVLPERFRGMPQIDSSVCGFQCRKCIDVCPAHAIEKTDNKLSIDLGRCIFCGKCGMECPEHSITFTRDYSLAARDRVDLVRTGATGSHKAGTLDPERLRIFSRSIRFRQVSAGGCGACEADINVLNTLVFDLSRFGIQFVASPRHADGLVITGPVTKNMELALKKTYDAIPSPKVVIVVGTCAISGGVFAGNSEVNNGVGKLFPVDLFIPGCPPHPYTILDGFLRLLGRVE